MRSLQCHQDPLFLGLLSLFFPFPPLPKHLVWFLLHHPIHCLFPGPLSLFIQYHPLQQHPVWCLLLCRVHPHQFRGTSTLLLMIQTSHPVLVALCLGFCSDHHGLLLWMCLHHLLWLLWPFHLHRGCLERNLQLVGLVLTLSRLPLVFSASRRKRHAFFLWRLILPSCHAFHVCRMGWSVFAGRQLVRQPLLYPFFF